jgi:PTH1 family peptidyl-tRNA hydrolase
MIKLIVALGNPGKEYEFTRHNIAWLSFDEFFESQKNIIWKNKFKGEYTEISYGDQKIYFLKPHTYMNLSGESVQALCSFFKISPSEIFVIHDEIDLEWGKIVLKKGGGHAGHNGLKSMAQHLGSSEFLRLRLGIGKPVHGSVSSWVLGSFAGDQVIELERILKTSSEIIHSVMKNGFEKTASQFSGKTIL